MFVTFPVSPLAIKCNWKGTNDWLGGYGVTRPHLLHTGLVDTGRWSLNQARSYGKIDEIVNVVFMDSKITIVRITSMVIFKPDPCVIKYLMTL